MATDCDHQKATVDTANGEQEVCLICDDVEVFTTDEDDVLAHIKNNVEENRDQYNKMGKQ